MKDLMNEEKIFLRSLEIESAKPDPKFKNKLKAQTLKKYNQKFDFGAAIFGLLGTAIFSLVVILLGSSFFNSAIPQVETINSNFTQAEKTSVYESILKNNPVSIVTASTRPEVSNTQEIKTSAVQAISSVQNKYTDSFYLAEFTTLTQVYADTCTSLKVKNGETAFSEYRDKDKYYAKTIIKDSNNKIVSYNLNKINGKRSEKFTYKDGGNVVRSLTFISDKPSVKPISFPLSFPDQISEAEENFFKDSILEEKIKKGNKEFYVLKTEIEMDCSNEVLSYPISFAKNMSKVITLSYFNAETFNLELTETYIDNLNKDNLLYTQSFLKKEKIVELDKVEREFEFDLAVSNIPKIIIPTSYTVE